MTVAPASKKKPAARRHPRDTDFVLPAALTQGHRSRGPRLGKTCGTYGTSSPAPAGKGASTSPVPPVTSSAAVRVWRPVRRVWPAIPCSRMTRSTRLWLTGRPWRRSSAVTRGTP
jgi:hypothetical protein